MYAYPEDEPIHSEEFFRLIWFSTNTSIVGPDGLSSILIKLGPSFLLDLMSAIVQKSFATDTVPDLRKSATGGPIPKHKTLRILSKEFQSIAIPSSALKLIEPILYSCLSPDLTILNDCFPFAHKKNRCTLNAVVSLRYSVCKGLSICLKSVRCIFLDYSFLSGSVPLHKHESFSCSASIL